MKKSAMKKTAKKTTKAATSKAAKKRPAQKQPAAQKGDPKKKAAPKKAAPPKAAAAKQATKRVHTQATPNSQAGVAAVEARIRDFDDWRGALLARLRGMILKAIPDAVEELKWAKSNSPGVPVWSHGGIICTGEVYKDKVKLTFAKGASLPDPTSFFNSSLEGNTRRAVDFFAGDKVNEKALKDLVRAAAALNASKQKR